MKKMFTRLTGWMVCLLPLAGFAETRDLLRGAALAEFREVAQWRGVSEVSAVAEKCEFELKGEGKILVNSTTKDKTLPYLMT